MADENNIVEELAGKCTPCLVDGKIPIAEIPDANTLLAGTNLYLVDEKIGIGNPAPAQALDIIGNLLTQGQNILGGVTYPRTDAAYSLGSPAYRWIHGYFSGNIVIDGLVDGIDVSTIPETYQPVTAKNQANGYAGLGADTKINSAQLPAIAIVDTFTATDETEQLALTVQKGDVCVRTDEAKTYINKTGDNVSMDDWEYLQSPTDAVQSVDGRTGIVTLNDLYEPLDATIMKEGENVSLLINDADFQTGAEVDAKIALIHVPWVMEIFGSSGVLFPNNDDGFCHIGAAGVITNTEGLAQMRMPKGKAISIQGYCSAGSGTFTIRKNGVDTGISGLVDSVGQFHITGTGPIDFEDGDLLSLFFDTGVGFTVYGVQVKFNSEVV